MKSAIISQCGNVGVVNVRLVIFYTMQFVNACLSNRTHSHHTIVVVTTTCVKFQGWVHRTFRDIGGEKMSHQITLICLL